MTKRLFVVLVAIVAIAVSVAPATPAEAISSSETRRLQQLLIEKGFLRGNADGIYGSRTSQAVMAFRKEIGVSRSFSWSSYLWDELEAYKEPFTKYSEPDRFEVNLTRQVAYLYRGGELRGVFPIASGNGETYLNSYGNPVRAYTPTGNYSFYLHRNPPGGWHESYLGFLYKPWYFSGGYAIHGSNSVPAYPASHGCVRLTTWDADWLQSRLFVGMPVHIWYEPKGVGPIFEGDGPFYDVDADDKFVEAITWMVDKGVTEGCRLGYFCPDETVSRAQLASFLARAMVLAPVDTGPFRDIGGSVHEGNINALAAIGATNGCTEDGFCPNNLVTREQAASIVARALGLEPIDDGHFIDLRGSVHTGNINALYQADVTNGCGPEHFCPRVPMTRGEVAAFLYRAFGPSS